MKNLTFHLKKILPLASGIGLLVLLAFKKPEESTVVIQQTLLRHYNAGAEGTQLKRFELQVTPTGFCRYRKIYQNGKVEFYSFNLLRFKDMDYYGNMEKGQLYLRTNQDDVIVQTRNDRKGDVDTMATQLILPLKEVDENALNTLYRHLKQVNQALVIRHQ